MSNASLQYAIVLQLAISSSPFDTAGSELAAAAQSAAEQLARLSLRHAGAAATIWDDLDISDISLPAEDSAERALAPVGPSETFNAVSQQEAWVTPSTSHGSIAAAAAAASSAPATIHSDARFGPLSIDWADMPSATDALKSGRIDIGSGVIHLLRETDTFVPPSELGEDATVGADGTVLAILAIPSVMSVADLLVFVEPATEMISQIRILRDAMPQRCMALLKLRTSQDALDFLEEYNGKPFWEMLDDEICHVVRVRSVEITATDGPTFAVPFGGSVARTPPAMGLVELPTCPVCLERMDVNATGLITIMCQHTFHCHCLSKWASGKCPVCRYSQARLKPGSSSTSSSGESTSTPTICADCSSTQSLWMCLICGHVGCGRYQGRHAFLHYADTTHIYAMELETQRVWDYAGDAYVHRLLMNKTDGKLVELPSLPGQSTADAVASAHHHSSSSNDYGPNAAAALAQEKVEAIGLEYSHLLATQLDSQRAYYLAKLTQLKDDLASAERERDRLNKKTDKSLELAKRVQRELETERTVSRGLLANLEKGRERSSATDAEVDKLRADLADMQDQVRDLMFALTARDKIEAADQSTPNSDAASKQTPLGELVGGSISVPEPATAPSPAARRRKKR